MKKPPKSHRLKKIKFKKKPAVKFDPATPETSSRLPSVEPPDPGSLLDCDSMEKVNTWFDQGYDRLNYKALKGIEKPSLPDDIRAQANNLLLEPDGTSALMMASKNLMRHAYNHLVENLHALAEADPDMKFALVTIIDGEDETSMDRPRITLKKSQLEAGKTLKSLAPDGEYFAVTESGFFNSMRHEDGGRHVSTHTHALVFTRDISKFAKVAPKQALKYSANITGAKPIVIKPVATDLENLARVAAYLLKAPYKASNWCPPTDGKKGHMNHSEKGDRYIQYFRIALLRMMLTFEDCTFASGKGLEIRSTLIKDLRTLASTNVICNSRALHPDAIPAFVVEISQKLGKDHWSLPIIERK